jgi:hypothetical protein
MNPDVCMLVAGERGHLTLASAKRAAKAFTLLQKKAHDDDPRALHQFQEVRRYMWWLTSWRSR